MFTYEEALDYLYSFVDYSRARADTYSAEAFDLRRMVDFMRALGDPQDRYPTVHVTGTKGKGSVSAICASVLHAAGYRVGFYTSPHLQDFCERAQVNGELIPRATVIEIVEEMKAQVEAGVAPGITTFELTTALAFQYFARANVDVAVVEVGLGGRLDATNILAGRHPGPNRR
jgi:dihydrofolate synthase/folylpolyglutamate synthase